MNIKPCLIAAALAAALSGTAVAENLTAPQAEELLIRRGYSDISALLYENGYWVGSARDAEGRIEIRHGRFFLQRASKVHNSMRWRWDAAAPPARLGAGSRHRSRGVTPRGGR